MVGGVGGSGVATCTSINPCQFIYFPPDRLLGAEMCKLGEGAGEREGWEGGREGDGREMEKERGRRGRGAFPSTSILIRVSFHVNPSPLCRLFFNQRFAPSRGWI